MNCRVARLIRPAWPAVVILFSGLGSAAAPAGTAPAATGVSGEVTPAASTLSPPQMLAEATRYLPGMEEGAARVKNQVEQARAARDVIKLLCLRDKLGQIEVAMASARDRAEALRVATGRNDREQAAHEYLVLTVLRDHVTAMVAEANQCIGEEEGFIGDTAVTMQVDPDIPDESTGPPDEPFRSVPPQTTSPIQ
ncbi:MAG TPA: hypothetical protein PLU22_08645 [Polyangiaceae bacterium]|nr:hypothetical protein [Polyangiaceae bacterium]